MLEKRKNCKRRAILIVLDSMGVGELPDAGRFGDEGSDTFGHIAETMGDDFKIHVTGDCFVGQITIWGDGYGGSLYQEDRTERIKKLESRVRRLQEIRMAQVVSHKIEDCRNCFGVMPVSLRKSRMKCETLSKPISMLIS